MAMRARIGQLEGVVDIDKFFAPQRSPELLDFLDA